MKVTPRALDNNPNYRELISRSAQAHIDRSTFSPVGAPFNFEMGRHVLIPAVFSCVYNRNTEITVVAIQSEQASMDLIKAGRHARHFLRMFAVNGTQHAQQLMKELVEGNGWLNGKDTDIHADREFYPSDVAADKCYVAEAKTFGEGLFVITEAARRAVLSTEKTGSSTMDYMKLSEMEKLFIQVITDLEFERGSISLKIVPQEGGNMGCCSCGSEDSLRAGVFSKFQIKIAEGMSYRHVLLHEIAHAWSSAETSINGHGKDWQRKYNQLLAKYHNGIQVDFN